MPALISDVVPTPEPQQSTTPTSRLRTKKFAVLAVIGVVVVCTVAGVIVVSRKPTPSTPAATSTISAVQSDLQALKSDVKFPLYYPSPLPAGFTYTPSSVLLNGASISFPVTNSGHQIQIIQQAKPRLTEELKKVKSFPVLGTDAYIADLEGHQAGFIKTATTLIIFSPVGDSIDVDQLQLLMQSIKPL